MKQLVEWRFRFRLEPEAEVEEVPRAVAEAVIWDVATPWAEARGLGIGGGPCALGGGSWEVRFGLCATREGQLIPELQALALAGLMRKFCEERGGKLIGEVEDFAEVNARLDAALKQLHEESEADRQRNRENAKFRRPPGAKDSQQACCPGGFDQNAARSGAGEVTR